MSLILFNGFAGITLGVIEASRFYCCKKKQRKARNHMKYMWK